MRKYDQSNTVCDIICQDDGHNTNYSALKTKTRNRDRLVKIRARLEEF